MFQVNNENSSKLTIKSITSFWGFVVNFEQISYTSLVFVLLTLDKKIPAALTQFFYFQPLFFLQCSFRKRYTVHQPLKLKKDILLNSCHPEIGKPEAGVASFRRSQLLGRMVNYDTYLVTAM